MQGAQAVTTEREKEVEDVPVEIKDEDRVGYWMQRGFLAVLVTMVTLAITFGGWLIRSINEINTSSAVIAAGSVATQKDISDLKTSVYNLSLRGENWVTKDQMISSKEAILSQINLLKDQVNMLELRVQRIESTPPRSNN